MTQQQTQQQPGDDATTPYAAIGGEAGLRRLVDRFYAIMESDPAARALRAMHGDDLNRARAKLFDFLSGWLGGPRRYQGCVMGAHRRMPIGAPERDQWIACMERALAETQPHMRRALKEPFQAMADAMRSH